MIPPLLFILALSARPQFPVLFSRSSYPLYIVQLDTNCVFYVLLCAVVYYCSV